MRLLFIVCFVTLVGCTAPAIGQEDPLRPIPAKTVVIDPSLWPEPPTHEEIGRLMQESPPPPVQGETEVIAGPATRGKVLVDVLPDFKIELPSHVESRGLRISSYCSDGPCGPKLPALGLKSGDYTALIDREGMLLVDNEKEREIFKDVIIQRIAGGK